jgi:mono/diheme cytochrome c family protein
VTYTPLGDTLLIAHQGNNRVVGLDALNLTPLTTAVTPGSTETSPALLTLDVGTGLAPRGVLVDGVSGRLFTQDFMGRSVTVRDAAPLLTENRTVLPLIGTTVCADAELLSPAALQGKRLFYNAADPRMSADSYLSCASCHADGGHDGRVWDFTGRGEGLRRTTDLRGRSGMGHGAVHWSGNFDGIQDFEHDIRGAFGGTGFLNLTPTQFAAQHPNPASVKAGLSNDLDALAAYVASLTLEHTPRSPQRNADGSLTAAAVRGQAVFAAQDCASCHRGTPLTNSIPANAGTQSLLSGLRLGEMLPGIDTPTLHGLSDTRVYLHHGQAATLADVFNYTGGTLLVPQQAEFLTTVNAAAVGISTDNPAQGGGGFTRGALTGQFVYITNEGAGTSPGARFSSVDGGPGGPGRIALRYARQYNSGTALLRVNGVEQTLTALRQTPDNSWQISGWRWLTVEATLNPGPVNTIEILRGNGDLMLNAVLISNAADFAAAAPHRAVLNLSTGDRDDLFTFLRQQDGRDATGQVLPNSITPATLDAAPEPITFFVPGAITLAVPSLANSPGWRVILESSTNLQQWTPVPGTAQIAPLQASWERHLYTLPAGPEPRLYFRSRLAGPGE